MPTNNAELPELPGIDVPAGLAVVRGNAKLYRTLLLKFSQQQQDFQQQLAQAQQNGLQSTASWAHSLKGMAANLGMKEVQASALALEMRCKEKAPIDLACAELVQTMSGVLHSLKALESE